MQDNQSVAQMTTEVLARQAGTRADMTGESLERALRAVLETEAGRRLGELRDGKHRDERADQWQPNLPWERAEERRQHRLEKRALLREEERSRAHQAAWESFIIRSGCSSSCARTANSSGCLAKRWRGSRRRPCDGWPAKTKVRQKRGWWPLRATATCTTSAWTSSKKGTWLPG